MEGYTACEPDVVDVTGATPVMAAAANGDGASLDLLLQRGGEQLLCATDKSGRSALTFALVNGHVELAKAIGRYEYTGPPPRERRRFRLVSSASPSHLSDCVRGEYRAAWSAQPNFAPPPPPIADHPPSPQDINEVCLDGHLRPEDIARDILKDRDLAKYYKTEGNERAQAEIDEDDAWQKRQRDLMLAQRKAEREAREAEEQSEAEEKEAPGQ